MTRMTTAALLLCTAAFGQGRTVLDGVYTEPQARRGEVIYGANCTGCHGDAMQGKSDPPLRGTSFIDRWREDSLDVVFQHMRTLMPARAPGSLPETAYLDILALVLEANGFPPGPKELDAATLPSILLIGKNGPQQLPTNATVRVAGCLMQGANEIWNLANAAIPVRARNGDQVTPNEIEAAKPVPPGSASFRLGNMDEFKPEPWKSHKVIVKGVLNRSASGDRIHVLAMSSVSPDCVK
jgi:S-disulfanyl-L-cysteine oxidoreductase SoxD